MSENARPENVVPDNSWDRVIILHGFGAGIDDHWFGWLAGAVRGAERVVLPASDAPRFADWLPVVAAAIGTPTRRTAVVAHSLGCLTAVRALQRLAPGSGPGAFVAVAPFAEPLLPIGDPGLDAFLVDGLPAFLDGLDLAAARAAIGRTVVLRSDADPIVPAAASDAFAAGLGAPVRVVPGAGHFLADEGIDRLPAALDALAGTPAA